MVRPSQSSVEGTHSPQKPDLLSSCIFLMTQEGEGEGSAYLNLGPKTTLPHKEIVAQEKNEQQISISSPDSGLVTRLSSKVFA